MPSPSPPSSDPSVPSSSGTVVGIASGNVNDLIGLAIDRMQGSETREREYQERLAAARADWEREQQQRMMSSDLPGANRGSYSRNNGNGNGSPGGDTTSILRQLIQSGGITPDHI